MSKFKETATTVLIAIIEFAVLITTVLYDNRDILPFLPKRSEPPIPDTLRINFLQQSILELEENKPVPDSIAEIIFKYADEGVDITRQPYSNSGYPCLFFQDKRAKYAYQLEDKNASSYAKKFINNCERYSLFSIRPISIYEPDKGNNVQDYYLEFFTDPFFLRYKELIQKKKYKEAKLVLNHISAETEYVDFDPDDPYSLIAEEADSVNLGTIDVLAYAKYSLASISENARLRCLTKDNSADDWLAGSMITGASYLAPSQKLFSSVYDYKSELITLFSELSPFIAVNYHNSDPRWVYNTALFLKWTSVSATSSKQDPEDIFESFLIGYKDVKRILKPGECAIEIVKAPSLDFSFDEYKAVILRPEWDGPKIVPLSSSEKINKEISLGRAYTDVQHRLYQLIWKPISQYLNQNDIIYLSTDGILSMVNIRAIPTPDHKTLSSNYDIRYCVSTKDIAKKDNAIMNPLGGNPELALFGGMIYDDIEIDRAEYNYLPESKDEVKIIDSLAASTHISCSVFTGENASEETFKSLDGKDLKILHIATHGFYYPAPTISGITFFEKMIQSNDPLNRCGLLFSKTGNEDGILLGTEIAGMDLSSVDLVVLSACNTGLGEISYQGISGLQQAFKLAGAHSIILTLDNVNDTAAKIFMTSFYKSLFECNDKQTAFNYAVDALKYSKEFSNPLYWAPFILLN